MLKKFFFAVCFLQMIGNLFAQSITQKLQKAFTVFASDPQLKHATSSLYVIDAKTGKVVFDKNSLVGLAPASTQKIITSVTAFELLGKDFRYETRFKVLGGQLGAIGGGDPTFGSWRFNSTKDTTLFDEIIKALKNKGIKQVLWLFLWDDETEKKIPGGWIYDDIANYYGAAPHKLNWHENQYDIVFIPGKKTGDDTKIDTAATFFWSNIRNRVKTGPPGSGDRAYAYYLWDTREVLVEGTVPAGVSRFKISGAHKMPSHWFNTMFNEYSKRAGFVTGDSVEYEYVVWPLNSNTQSDYLRSYNSPDYIHYSPTLDSIIYWFNKKSINLYGEALIKTFANKIAGVDNPDTGLALLTNFWKQKGLDKNELNMYDGSGLSPLNRVTTHAQVEILKYARTRDWFPYFYNALPEYNNMKMKSGTISDVKGFCGYHTSKNGKEYIFSFLVNNYNGPSSGLVNKMYRVLDELK